MRRVIALTVAGGLILIPAAVAAAAGSPEPDAAAAGAATSASAAVSATADTGQSAEPPQGSEPAPRLLDQQLVVATLDPSGLPEQASVINRLVARDLPEQQILLPTSTTDVRYLNRSGLPTLANDGVVVDIGGPGQTSVMTQAVFGKPLPIALHAEYATTGQHAEAIDPAEVPGSSGELAIDYQVTNTSVEKQEISYSDSAGNLTRTTQPVFAPFAGVLQATLPSGVELLRAPGAIVNTDSDGRTQLLWNLVLYPPLGDYVQNAKILVRSSNMAIPAVTMQVTPVTSGQDPSAGFATELLKSSVDGNAKLAAGLDDIDEAAAKVAAGAAQLAAGMRKLKSGSAQLSDAMNGKLAPGARKLASGAAAVASGAALVAAGLGKLSGASGLPAAVSAAQQLADAVAQIADKVGAASDPPIPFPPDPNKITLVQAIRASMRGSEVARDGAAVIAAELLTLAAQVGSLGIQATTVAGQAQSAADTIDGVYTANCPGLGVSICASLDSARTNARAAQTGATGIATSAAAIAVSLGVQQVRETALSAGLGLLVRALDQIEDGLLQVSVALRSGNAASPGVYEGLVALVAGLEAAAQSATKLSDGADATADGSQQVAVGAADEAVGVALAAQATDVLDQSAGQLADGSDALADGSKQLRADGTSRMYAQVVDASKEPALASAYLEAADARASSALPYGPPEGAVGEIAYVYTLQPPPSSSRTNLAIVGLVAVFATGAAVLAIQRLRRTRSQPPGRPPADPAREPGSFWPFPS